MMFTCEQVAAIFNVKLQTVYRWVRKGIVEATKIGFRGYGFTADQIKKIEEARTGTTGYSRYRWDGKKDD